MLMVDRTEVGTGEGVYRNDPDKTPNNPKEPPRNPWQKGPQPEGGPPDLDQLFKDFQKKFREFLGQKPSRSTGFGGKTPPAGKPPLRPTGLGGSMGPFGVILAILVLAGYALSGIYIVQPAERAVVTRFGRYVRTELPGLHWLPTLIESAARVNVERRETSRHQGAMLTEDENIVSVDIAVQYRINNAKNFLFNVASPIRSLGEATESALRQVIGQSKLDEVLTSGRASVALAIKKQLIETLDGYGAGLEIYDVNMQPAKAPEEVRAAFDDVIKAREEHESLVYSAQAYANDILPKARGQAERMLEEANGYRAEMKLVAEGATKRFALVLPEYQKAPQVTRARLYLETMEQVLNNTKKVVIDTKNQSSTPLIYLPMDKLMSSTSADKPSVAPVAESPTVANVYREEAPSKPMVRRYSKERG